MLFEEFIWVLVGAASLLVGLLIWRGEGKPKIEQRKDDPGA
jgi:hypothetical protein